MTWFLVYGGLTSKNHRPQSRDGAGPQKGRGAQDECVQSWLFIASPPQTEPGLGSGLA